MSHIVSLVRANFYRSLQFAHRANAKPIFTNPIDFSISPGSKWAIIGSMKADFLKVLAGQYVSDPVSCRRYPLRNEDESVSVELLQFTNNSYGSGAINSSGGFTHLGARYEFFKDYEIDEKVTDFVCGITYNSTNVLDEAKFTKLLNDLQLKGLENKFINGLSNGQFRRARIAKALYADPTLLLIDDPFLGLDPSATKLVSDVLGSFDSTAITIGLRIQDDIPEWIEKVAIVDESGVVSVGTAEQLRDQVAELKKDYAELQSKLADSINKEFTNDVFESKSDENANETIIEMDNVNVAYSGKSIIKDLKWKVSKGEKWHIRGKNGSGKTTLLSLITLDHPQAWNRSIKINGVERRTGSTNFFDTNSEIGFTSPELHAMFPKRLTVFQSISTGYVVGSMIPPRLESLTTKQIDQIKKYLQLVGLSDKSETSFGELSVSDQKLVLLIRALVKNPKILILDESLSAMSDENILKGKALINQWEHGCVLIIGHVDHEVPDCDKYILLNDASEGMYEIGTVGVN